MLLFKDWDEKDHNHYSLSIIPILTIIIFALVNFLLKVWTISNALWFGIGSFLGQGCDILPKYSHHHNYYIIFYLIIPLWVNGQCFRIRR